MKQIKVNDALLCYEEQGQGVPVLFVHGSLSCRNAFEKQAATLCGEYRCIRFDLRSHGESTGGDWTSLTHCADILALLDGLGIEKAHIVSHSMGSEVSMFLAVNHPERLLSLTTVSSAGMPNVHVAEFLHTLGREIDTEKYADFVERLNAEQKGDWRRLIELTIRNCDAFPGFTDEELRRVTVPMLAIRGERDNMVLDAEMERLAAVLPDFRFGTVPGAGHMLHRSRKSADEVSRILRNFLDSVHT